MPKAKPDTDLQAIDTVEETPAKIGRPTVMTEAVQLEICARMSMGESLTKVCKDRHMPARQTVTLFAAGKGAENSAFAARYARARDALLDAYADDIVMIADDGTTDYVMKKGRNGHEYMAVDQEHIQRSRLRVDARKWILSKLRPEQYGDKPPEVGVNVNVNTLDITSLPEREKMRRFALFMAEDQQAPAIEGTSQPVPDDGTKSQAGTTPEDDDVPA